MPCGALGDVDNVKEEDGRYDKIVDKLLDWPETGNIAVEDEKKQNLLDMRIGSTDSQKSVFLRRTYC